MVNGEAIVTLEDKQIALKGGESVDIPLHAVHRMENPGKENMAFIEVQREDVFRGEMTLSVCEDDFKRE